jgi:nitrate/nitrite-specific signal transduction histidine kinase
VSVILARRVTQPVAQLTAAAADIESGIFAMEDLAGAAQRADELGQLARVFQRMAREVYAREQRLKQQVQQLRIEIDQVKKARQVAEITETEYFQHLREHAAEMRNRAKAK